MDDTTPSTPQGWLEEAHYWLERAHEFDHEGGLRQDTCFKYAMACAILAMAESQHPH